MSSAYSNGYFLENSGTYWSAGEMRQLVARLYSGQDIKTVARKHRRSVTACEAIYRDVRRIRLLETGGDSDTLITLRKRA